MKEVKIGVIGFGTIGSGVAKCLLEQCEAIAKRTGVKPTLAKIADVDIESDRGVNVPRELLTTDVNALIRDVDVVVELVGGTTIAKDFVLEALRQSKPVVTANKALIAECGEEIFAAAKLTKADIFYEASVAGGIPIIKSLREGLVANQIESIYAILNGTCNYILTKMDTEKVPFEDALLDAQNLGYAEADPALDIDGGDSAHKAAIIASLVYGEWFGKEPIFVQGIRDMSLLDLDFADELGYRVKLLAIIKKENDDVQIRVHPTLLPKNSLLADIGDVFNGVMVKGEPVGDLLFYGQGAGRDATTSAVVADVVDVCLNLKFGSHRRVPAFRFNRQFRNLIDMGEIKSRYYLRVQVKDQPGVIAKISSILAERDISISSVIQKEGQLRDNVSMLFLTHLSLEKSILSAIEEIEKLAEIRDKSKLIRIEDL